MMVNNGKTKKVNQCSLGWSLELIPISVSPRVTAMNPRWTNITFRQALGYLPMKVPPTFGSVTKL